MYCHNQNNCWAICPVVHIQDLQLWIWSPMQLNLDVPSFFGYPAFRELLMLWTLALDHPIPIYSLSPGSNVGDLLIAAASVVEDFDLARTSQCHCHAIMYCWVVRGIGSKDMSSCTTPLSCILMLIDLCRSEYFGSGSHCFLPFCSSGKHLRRVQPWRSS